jgi:hypothetical protein
MEHFYLVRVYTVINKIPIEIPNLNNLKLFHHFISIFDFIFLK